jgi:hypothetical protein
VGSFGFILHGEGETGKAERTEYNFVLRNCHNRMGWI